MHTAVDNWREGARTGHTHEPNDATIRLDGLGRQLADLPVQPSPPDPAEGPVFVDESGRRSKTYRRLGWFLATICAVYAATLVLAVLGGNSSAPWLPISGQEEKQADEVEVRPAPSVSTGTVSDSADAAPTSSTSAVDTGTASEPSTGGSVSAPGTAAGTGVSAPRTSVPPSGGQVAEDPNPGPSASEPDADGPTSPSTEPGDPVVVTPPPTADPSESSVQPHEGAQ
ncbi:hypothetical protein K373_05285 [Streptomyces sp. DvalAA-21]|nr:conserved hypothetical protein [Streptomyces sp. SirexAA-E]PZX33587.1 hypothetical protein K373_05285 [Streptomyces sp. DvalAA-21]RAJ29470.1 hypothetical protein K351_05297 [Streptomyces sp. DpondAA-E10]RAJ43437.1 hypothetical protein K352_05287 [Streptomyces sp. DpondAA-A50]SCD62369.1 hypothetical protein GA0115235_105211 [Streptomyces sp. DpondAA-F4a]SCL85170.1 hypothetical protein SAMN04883147_101743 [Streptomyces sp. DpondAA-F4]